MSERKSDWYAYRLGHTCFAAGSLFIRNVAFLAQVLILHLVNA